MPRLATVAVLLLAALASALAQGPADATDVVLEGQIEVLVGEHGPLYVLHDKNGVAVDLKLDESSPAAKGLFTGAQVRARGRGRGFPQQPRKPLPRMLRGLLQTQNGTTNSTAPPVAPSMDVQNVTLIGSYTDPTESPFVPDTTGGVTAQAVTPLVTPTDIASVAFVFTFCGLGASTTLTDLNARWFSSSTNGYTMQGYHTNCSYNGLRFRPGYNLIAPRVINVACRGAMKNGMKYDLSTSCGTNELYALMEAGENATAALGMSIPTYNKRRIAIMPVNAKCAWTGMGSLGCAGARCNTWINGMASRDVPVMFHELSHNLGAMHSRRGTDEYGDTGCVMGSGNTCFNAAQLWRLGWAAPVTGGAFRISALGAGVWKSFRVPAQHVTNRNMVRIVPDNGAAPPAGAPWTPFYLSYRVRAPPFESLSTTMAPRVMVHAYNNTAVGSITLDRTLLTGIVASGSASYGVTLYGVRRFAVKVSSATATAVTISVCRPTTSTQCL